MRGPNFNSPLIHAQDFSGFWGSLCHLVTRMMRTGKIAPGGKTRHVIELISAKDSTHVIALLVKAHKFHCAIWINLIMLAERCRVGCKRNKFSMSPDIRSFDLLLNGTFKHGFIFFFPAIATDIFWGKLYSAKSLENYVIAFHFISNGQYFMNIIFIDS